jgi:protease PrsW
MNYIELTCPNCHKNLEIDDALPGQEVQCPSCSQPFKAKPPVPVSSPGVKIAAEPAGTNDVQRIASQLSESLTTFAGVEKFDVFRQKDMFSEVFGKHSSDEIEEYFTVGTPSTTPAVSDLDTSWPKPWVFFRTFIGALVVYLLFLISWNVFGNLNLIPGLILVGSFAVPVTTLIFFFEMNAWRNISLYQLIRLLFLGGILSLILSLLLFELTAPGLSWLGASLAGLVEEPGKLLALLAVASIPRYRYKLNGLLLGAAVGAGFAAFESAGYALRMGLQDTNLMQDTIMVRGMLSPLGHIAWTAMCGAALWRVKGASKFSFSMLKDKRFLNVFALAVILHMLWNTPISLPFYGKFAILGVVAWIVILGLIQEGLKELRAESAAAVTRARKKKSKEQSG